MAPAAARDELYCLRGMLLECYRAALAAVDARVAVRRALANGPGEGSWRVIALGKAASSMTLGALDVLGDRLESGTVVTPDAPPPGLAGQRRFACLQSAHPVPDERSLHAGEQLLQAISSSPADAQWLFLVSGGASSLVEAPLQGVGLDDLRTLNAWLLGAGVPIKVANGLRRRCSRLKGGGLARALQGRRGRALFVSDVPGDDPCLIGSGPVHASPAQRLPEHLPPPLASLMRRLPEVDSTAPFVPSTVVATLADARVAVFRAAIAAGFAAQVSARRFHGRAEGLGRRLADATLALRAGSLRVWGGESVVVLPERVGRGGRSQQLALAAALRLHGRTGVALLAAGTDGIDGNTRDAGALVDGDSRARMLDAGLDAASALRAADSGTALEASGDLIHTGPTGTNVGDLVIAARTGARP